MDVSMHYDKKDYDGYMLMKFWEKEEYQQEFLDGKLFFNTADYFAKCDQNGRGDHNEGNTFVIDYENPNYVAANLEKVGDTYAIVVRDYSNNPTEFKRGTIWDYSAAINRNRKIISFYTMFVNIEQQLIAPFDPKMKEEFGEFGILILNRQEFFERVYNALNKNDEYANVGIGFIEYQPREKQQGITDWNPFIKKDDFDYQNELRITFTSNTDKPVKIDLGCSLKDIVVPIYYKDLDRIHFDDGKLLYPIYR